MASVMFSSLQAAALLTALILFFMQVAGAQVMSSPSYQLQSDSVNVGGGLSSSTNYTQESTTGEVATGPSDSASFSLRAGYQQMQEVYVSMSAPANVTMDTNLGGLTGGTSNGSTTVTIITDAPAGYLLTIEAENNPAMQRYDAEQIADYDDGGSTDYTFTTGASDAHFGFTPTGVDITGEFADDGVSGCGGGGDLEAIVCWDGLSTTARTISSDSSANHPSGATTTVHFRVGLGGSVFVLPGDYYATTTLTAIAQ